MININAINCCWHRRSSLRGLVLGYSCEKTEIVLIGRKKTDSLPEKAKVDISKRRAFNCFAIYSRGTAFCPLHCWSCGACIIFIFCQDFPCFFTDFVQIFFCDFATFFSIIFQFYLFAMIFSKICQFLLTAIFARKIMENNGKFVKLFANILIFSRPNSEKTFLPKFSRGKARKEIFQHFP